MPNKTTPDDPPQAARSALGGRLRLLFGAALAVAACGLGLAAWPLVSRSAPPNWAAWLVAAAFAATLLLIAPALWLLSTQVLAPIGALIETLRHLAAGETNTPLVGRHRADEVGALMQALSDYCDLVDEKEWRLADLEARRGAAEGARQELDRLRREADTARIEVLLAVEQGLTRLAEGDLTIQLTEPFAEAFEPIRVNFNSTAARLHDAVALVVANSREILDASHEMSKAFAALSQRSAHQAQGMEQISGALTSLAGAVRASASATGQVDEAVAFAMSEADRSGDVVQKTIAAMGQIVEAVAAIGAITEVIDSIAFQTNLLALNAGVEAARAGDAGRGFAVVAQEVRALAQRSALSADNIQKLIQTSKDHVDRGVHMVGATGETMNRVVDQVTEISNLMTEIVSATRDQARGLDSVHSVAVRTDADSQANAGLAESCTEAAAALNQRAGELVDLIHGFSIRPEALAQHAPSRRTLDITRFTDSDGAGLDAQASAAAGKARTAAPEARAEDEIARLFG